MTSQSGVHKQTIKILLEAMYFLTADIWLLQTTIAAINKWPAGFGLNQTVFWGVWVVSSIEIGFYPKASDPTYE